MSRNLSHFAFDLRGQGCRSAKECHRARADAKACAKPQPKRHGLPRVRTEKQSQHKSCAHKGTAAKQSAGKHRMIASKPHTHAPCKARKRQRAKAQRCDQRIGIAAFIGDDR